MLLLGVFTTGLLIASIVYAIMTKYRLITIIEEADVYKHHFTSFIVGYIIVTLLTTIYVVIYAVFFMNMDWVLGMVGGFFIEGIFISNYTKLGLVSAFWIIVTTLITSYGVIPFIEQKINRTVRKDTGKRSKKQRRSSRSQREYPGTLYKETEN